MNNSIVLIDTFNRLKKENIDPVTAVLMTAAQRTRPVILTTVTTIFGLLPMALGISINFFGRTIELGAPSGAWWTSLSTALVSGLAFSSLLTLFLVPVLLTAPTIWKQQLKSIWAWIVKFLATSKPKTQRPATIVEEPDDLVSTPAMAKEKSKSEKPEITGKPATTTQAAE